MNSFSHFCIFLFFYLSRNKHKVTTTLLYVEIFIDQDDWFPDNQLISQFSWDEDSGPLGLFCSHIALCIVLISHDTPGRTIAQLSLADTQVEIWGFPLQLVAKSHGFRYVAYYSTIWKIEATQKDEAIKISIAWKPKTTKTPSSRTSFDSIVRYSSQFLQ